MLAPPTTRRGWMGRVPAGLKMLLAIGVVLLVAMLPRGQARWLGVVGAALILLTLVSGAGLWPIAQRLLKAEPLALGVAGLAFLQPNGWMLAGILLAKSTLCLLTMVLLAATTPVAEMLVVMRAVRVPSLLVMTVALMVRYVGVLGDEAHRMRRARMSRTFTASKARTWLNLGSVVAHLFVRTTDRAERIYDAMCARGGGGNP